METQVLDQATELVEKANANLEPELLTAEGARTLLATYARLERLASFGIALLTRKLNDPGEIAKATGSSVGKAKALVATGETLAKSGELAGALQHGDISLDQATHIAAAEEAAPGAAAELVAVARSEPFHVMKDKAQRVKLEAEQHRDLATRQRRARFGRSHADPLGMGAHPPRPRAARRRADSRPGRG